MAVRAVSQDPSAPAVNITGCSFDDTFVVGGDGISVVSSLLGGAISLEVGASNDLLPAPKMCHSKV